jgi:hypothetical protein
VNYIFETIVTVRGDAGRTQVTPLGVRQQGDWVVLAPFKPSLTLDLLLQSRAAVINCTDDVRVFAGWCPPRGSTASGSLRAWRTRRSSSPSSSTTRSVRSCAAARFTARRMRRFGVSTGLRPP